MTDSYTDWNEVPLLLTVDEAAAILRVHANTVTYLIRNGQLPASKIGRAWRITRESVMGMADCAFADRALVRDLAAALAPFSRLTPVRVRDETDSQAIPLSWIEQARTALARVRASGIDIPSPTDVD